MNKATKIILAVAILVLIIWGISSSKPTTSVSADVSVVYTCNGGKSIDATFKNGGKNVSVELSDGRSLDLAQGISADGVRYSNTDDSFVFWTKGNGALVLESNAEKSYIGCIKVAPKPEGSNLSFVYTNSQEGFSLRLPGGSDAYVIDEKYTYPAFGPGKNIHGIKFTIPSSFAKGTNLSNDSYISVESIPQVESCSAQLFLSSQAQVGTVTEGSTTYSVANLNDAAAGNRYEETVYAIPGTNPCKAIRYFIHYGVIENYPKGAVKEFDKQTLVNTFDQIRETLVLI